LIQHEGALMRQPGLSAVSVVVLIRWSRLATASRSGCVNGVVSLRFSACKAVEALAGKMTGSASNPTRSTGIQAGIRLEGLPFVGSFIGTRDRYIVMSADLCSAPCFVRPFLGG
jgi:hypothetical protein